MKSRSFSRGITAYIDQPLDSSATAILVLSAATVFKQCLSGVQEFSQTIMATQPPHVGFETICQILHDMWPSKMPPDAQLDMETICTTRPPYCI